MREQIIESALGQIVCNGFRKFTIDAIAADLGISKKTIYKHFQTKENIVTAVVDRIVLRDEIHNRSIMDRDEAALHKIEAIIRCEVPAMAPWIWNELKQSLPQEWAKVEARSEAGKNLVIQLINEAVEAGDLRPEMDTVVLGILIGKVQEMVMDMKFLISNNLTMDSVLGAVRSIFLLGILSEETRKDYIAEVTR